MSFFTLWVIVIIIAVLACFVFGETGLTYALGLGGIAFLINAVIKSGKGGSSGDDNFPEPPDDFDL